MRIVVAQVIMTGGGCGSKPPAAPSAAQDGGDGAPITITGSERIGWSQAASGLVEANGLRYRAYVDGLRTSLPDAGCQAGTLETVFPCSARLPQMSGGVHRLELTAVAESGGPEIESARSPVLSVMRQ